MRHPWVTIRLLPDEREALDAAAAHAGMGSADWAREVLLRQALGLPLRVEPASPKKPRQKWLPSPEAAERILAELQAGPPRSDRVVAEKLGVSREAVYTVRHRAGLPSSRPTRKARLAGQVVQLHAQGATNKEIAQKLGTRQETIRTLLYYLGLKANRAGSGPDAGAVK